jgi:hypothetical protein
MDRTQLIWLLQFPANGAALICVVFGTCLERVQSMLSSHYIVPNPSTALLVPYLFLLDGESDPFFLFFETGESDFLRRLASSDDAELALFDRELLVSTVLFLFCDELVESLEASRRSPNEGTLPESGLSLRSRRCWVGDLK